LRGTGATLKPIWIREFSSEELWSPAARPGLETSARPVMMIAAKAVVVAALAVSELSCVIVYLSSETGYSKTGSRLTRALATKTQRGSKIVFMRE
jgi:hypothetical protein